MHILGNVLAGFAMVGSIGAIFLVPKVHQVRNEWMKRVETRKAEYLKVAGEPAKLKQELWDLEREYSLVNYDWGPVWSGNLQVQVVSAVPGSVTLALNGIGAAEGIRQDQVLQVFQPDKGGSRYVGPFRVTGVQDGLARVVSTWPAREPDYRTWKFDDGARVRTAVPVSAAQNFVRMQHEMSLKDVVLRDAKTRLDQAETKDRDYAKDQLQFRIDELHGDLGLQGKKGSLPNYLIDGLVSAIEEAEENRNVTLEEVDDLRQSLQDVYDEVQTLRTRNAKLIEKLPVPPPVSAARDSLIGSK